MNDTSEFADKGYGLWIAHYADEPRVFGNNWGGNGWAFWQFTSKGSVPGISGNVDRDTGASGAITDFRIPVPPSVKTQPVITGTAATGETLSVSPGSWKGTKPMSFSYRWKRCEENGSACTTISGERDPIYAIKKWDYGHRLRAVVTATNEAGSASSSTILTDLVADGKDPKTPTVSSKNGTFMPALKMTMRWSSSDDITDVVHFETCDREAAKRGDFGPWTGWLSDTKKTSATLKGAPGHTYCYQARATDDAGNSSVWSTKRCVAVRLDDVQLSGGSNWDRTGGRADYQRTIISGKKRGATLKLTGIEARRFDLLATTCKTCGKVEVRIGNKVLARVSLFSKKRHDRVAIELGSFSETRRGTIYIEILSGGKKVMIDGLGIWRGEPWTLRNAPALTRAFG